MGVFVSAHALARLSDARLWLTVRQPDEAVGQGVHLSGRSVTRIEEGGMSSADAQVENTRGEIRRLGEESAHYRAKWREEWERARKEERHSARLQTELEQARAEVERLSSERSRHASEALQEGRSAAAARAALLEAQSEAHVLRTERELLHERLVNSEAHLAGAERRLTLLRSQLAEVPANVDAIMVRQLREKLLDSSRKKTEYKRIARESIARAGSLALQVRELEAELHLRLA